MTRRIIGVSLKMYFGYDRTLRWSREIVDIAGQHPALRDRSVELFILPSFPAVAPVLEHCQGTSVAVGAQDLFWEDEGAFTGEVSGSMLREMGCRYVEVGHAERRKLFGEDERVVAAKTAAALRNELIPVLCLGEEHARGVDDAVRTCRDQLDSALRTARDSGLLGPITVAYEPQWAIGAEEPASAEFIGAVCGGLRASVDSDPALNGSRIIYGGSAKPGLLTTLSEAVDGLFLGRFAHDSRALETILGEAAAGGGDS